MKESNISKDAARSEFNYVETIPTTGSEQNEESITRTNPINLEEDIDQMQGIEITIFKCQGIPSDHPKP